MQRLERLAAVAELGRQPVEQLGMRRELPHPAEVVGGGDDSPAEMVLPDAVDDRLASRAALRGSVSQSGQRRAAVSLGVARREVERPRQLGQDVQGSRRRPPDRGFSRRRGGGRGSAAACRRPGRFPGTLPAAVVNRPRVDQARRLELRQLGLDPGQLGR